MEAWLLAQNSKLAQYKNLLVRKLGRLLESNKPITAILVLMTLFLQRHHRCADVFIAIYPPPTNEHMCVYEPTPDADDREIVCDRITQLTDVCRYFYQFV